MLWDRGVAARGLPHDCLVIAIGSHFCQALGDLKANAENGDASDGCAGAHTTAGSCPWTGAYAQNSCCARGGGSFHDKTAIVTYELAVTYLVRLRH